MTTWRSWFPEREPAKVTMREVLYEAARRAVQEQNCQVGWLESGATVQLADRDVDGYAQREGRRVFVPLPETVSDLSVLLHEVGHIATDFRGATNVDREVSAIEWALRKWAEWDLPDRPLAEFAQAWRFEGLCRREIVRGNTTLAAASACVPPELASVLALDRLEPKGGGSDLSVRQRGCDSVEGSAEFTHVGIHPGNQLYESRPARVSRAALDVRNVCRMGAGSG